MNFTTKQEYLDFAATWKADYAQLSADIRKSRIEYNDAQRAFSILGRYDYHWVSDATKAYWVAHSIMTDSLIKLQTLRIKATDAISVRHSSKEAAQDAYLASRK